LLSSRKAIKLIESERRMGMIKCGNRMENLASNLIHFLSSHSLILGDKLYTKINSKSELENLC
jgi:hypothetical protein